MKIFETGSSRLCSNSMRDRSRILWIYSPRSGAPLRFRELTPVFNDRSMSMSELRSQENGFDFKKENKMKTKGKVLVLVSSGHGLPLQDGKLYSGAGYYLNELTVPVRALMKEGYEITFANPKGNTPQMDVNSATAMFCGGDEAKLKDYLNFRDSLSGLKTPTHIADVIASGLDQYDAVFVPG